MVWYVVACHVASDPACLRKGGVACECICLTVECVASESVCSSEGGVASEYLVF